MGKLFVKKYSQDTLVSLYSPDLLNWVITPSASGTTMLVRNGERFGPFFCMFSNAVLYPSTALLEYGEDVLDVAKYVVKFPDKEFRVHGSRETPMLDVKHEALQQFLKEYTDV